MNKKQNITTMLAIAGALLISGCNSLDTTDLSKAQPISHVQFNLPKQIQWVAVKNEKVANGGMIAEWVPKGYQSNNAPVRVVYQRAMPAKQPNTLLAQIAQPLQKQCSDSKVSPMKFASKYANQAGNEAICAKVGKNRFGLVAYTNIFADAKANHLVTAEIKTLPSEKAGFLTPKNASEKKQVQNTKALIGLMKNFMNSVRACDAEKKCM